jgi:hypothetical protein
MDLRTVAIFLFLTVFIGGGAAVLMGRNFATNWRAAPQVMLASVGLTLGIRFLHYALFWQPMFDPWSILLDGAVIVVLGLVGHRWRRAQQMTSQYYWLYERTSPFTWRQKTASADGAKG